MKVTLYYDYLAIYEVVYKEKQYSKYFVEEDFSEI